METISRADLEALPATQKATVARTHQITDPAPMARPDVVLVSADGRRLSRRDFDALGWAERRAFIRGGRVDRDIVLGGTHP